MSKYNISLIVPTRGRVDLLIRMIDSVLAFARHPNLIEFVLYIDNDDNSKYPEFPSNINVIRGERRSMSEMNCLCCEEASGRVLFLCNDDVIVRTQDWDKIILHEISKYSDEVYLLYPNDLYKGERLSTFPIVSKNTFLRFPDIMPRQYKGAFIDVHLFDIFKQLEGLGGSRLIYLESVVFEHFHHLAGKAKIDETYLNRNRFGDDQMFIFLSGARKDVSISMSDFIVRGAIPPLRKKDEKITANPLQLFLNSNARFAWRWKMTVYMVARKVYSFVKT